MISASKYLIIKSNALAETSEYKSVEMLSSMIYSRIIEKFYKLYVTGAILQRPMTFNQTLMNVCDRKLRGTRSNISVMNKLLHMLLTKESVLLFNESNFYTVKFSKQRTGSQENLKNKLPH